MIKRHHIPQHTPAWFKFRNENGYGGSEIASVLAQDQPILEKYLYKGPKEIHLQKIGEPVTPFSGNPNSEAGHVMEPIIIDLYRYWDNFNPDIMVMHENRRNKRKMNKARRLSCFVTNDKYPWLFYSPDGEEFDSREVRSMVYRNKSVGNLECKNTTSMEANRYPNKVSPSFVAQVALGLLITEAEYARIMILIDGWKLEVITIYNNDDWVTELQMQILETSYKSWQDVLKGRAIKEKYGIDNYYGYNVDMMTSMQQEGTAMLQALEPDFTGGEHEYEWVKKNVYQTEEFSKMELTPDQHQLSD